MKHLLGGEPWRSKPLQGHPHRGTLALVPAGQGQCVSANAQQHKSSYTFRGTWKIPVFSRTSLVFLSLFPIVTGDNAGLSHYRHSPCLAEFKSHIHYEKMVFLPPPSPNPPISQTKETRHTRMKLV